MLGHCYGQTDIFSVTTQYVCSEKSLLDLFGLPDCLYIVSLPNKSKHVLIPVMLNYGKISYQNISVSFLSMLLGGIWHLTVPNVISNFCAYPAFVS